MENVDLLSTISSALAAAAVAVNILPTGGQAAFAILGGASALFAAGAMAGHWIGNARGNGIPAWEIGLDTLGIIPGVGGVKAGVSVTFKEGLRKGLKEGTKKMHEGFTDSFSQKAINKVAKLIRGKELPANATQFAIKGIATAGGIFSLALSDNEKTEASVQTLQSTRHFMAKPPPGPFLTAVAA